MERFGFYGQNQLQALSTYSSLLLPKQKLVVKAATKSQFDPYLTFINPTGLFIPVNNLTWYLHKYLFSFHITFSQWEFLWGKKKGKSDFLQFLVFLRWSDKFALDMSKSNTQTALLCHSHNWH